MAVRTSLNSPLKNWQVLIFSILILLGTALLLAFTASKFTNIDGWFSYFIALSLGCSLLWLGWHSLKLEPRPGWLAGLLIFAALLRLGLGIFWTVALPLWGYQGEVENAGYVMEDAYKRDPAAWELAASGDPLWQAFTNDRGGDQYGGLLFLSALVYRYLGGTIHQPYLMIILGAAFSALAVIYTWALTIKLLGTRAALIAAWGIALYPEAVLLGSTQMREAYTIPLAAMAIYGLLRYRHDHKWPGLAFLLGALLFTLIISPPSAVLILLVLIAIALGLENSRSFRSRRIWFTLAGLAVVAVGAVWIAWDQIAPTGVSNPIELLDWWLRKVVDLQVYEANLASGWIQRIFGEIPKSLHLPFLIIYGIIQPFLPAALVASGAPIWQGIAIWRSLGWTLLFLLLLYSSWIWIRHPKRPAVIGMLQLVIWLIILIAALRSAGDQWDNPRYRATLASIQIAVAAWGLVERRRLRDVWLKRMVVGGTIIFAWFFVWYLGRYTPLEWPVFDPFKTLALGVSSAVLYLLWEFAKQPKKIRTGKPE